MKKTKGKILGDQPRVFFPGDIVTFERQFTLIDDNGSFIDSVFDKNSLAVVVAVEDVAMGYDITHNFSCGVMIFVNGTYGQASAFNMVKVMP